MLFTSKDVLTTADFFVEQNFQFLVGEKFLQPITALSNKIRDDEPF